MRPVRTIIAVIFAAALAVTGCSARSTAHPSAAKPTPNQPPTTTTTPAPTPTATHPRAPRPTTPPSPPPSLPPAPPQPTACRTAQLQLRTGQIEGAMGHQYITFAFQNRSSVACTMFGFPGVQLLDAHGSPLPTKVGHAYFDTGPARRVLLQPSGYGFFTLAEALIPSGSDPQPCPTATLAVTPPGQRQALTSPQALTPCGGEVAVTPVRSGELHWIS
jgi:Protein of unknown function (DUF4232)